jgi:methylamine--corrinoid protein Co-methyltransferase
LEARFNAEVAHAAAGLSRAEANEMIKEFQKHYVPYIDKKPIGKSFTEVYDVVTVRPKPEWQAMYDKVREDVAKIGLKLMH